MDFLGLGIGEILLILILIFLVLDPDKMPQVAKNIGKVIRQIKEASAEFIRDLTRETEKEVEEIKKETADSGEKDIVSLS